MVRLLNTVLILAVLIMSLGDLLGKKV